MTCSSGEVDNKETIQLTIDESLLAEAEQAARALDMSRSDFISAAFAKSVAAA